ncbi:MAG TPA: sugar phosphate isomerase/epimerase [Anaerolineales bacterium]
MNTIDRLGVQLYTLRSEMEKNLEETLSRVAAIGYQEVEFAGYFERSPSEIRHLLDQHGLSAPSVHVDYKSIEANLDRVVEAAQIIRHRYIVNSMIDPNLISNPDGWKQAAELFNRAGEFTRKAGIQFAYHNHFFEFLPLNGKLPYDILLESCDPEFLKMEMDFCWMAAVKQDPFPYFRRYPGRFPLVHLKQLKNIPARGPEDRADFGFFERAMPELSDVGEGVIDWKSVLSQSMQAGVQHFFVEHDAPQSPFGSIQASYAYLQELRLLL